MKRTTRYLVVAVAVFALLAGWLYSKRENATVRKDLRDFAVADTASITKIFLADRNNHRILLERKGPAEWTLNGSEKARQEGINQLLATMKRVAVQTRVAKSYYNLTIKDLAATGVKCEIYMNHSATPGKVYYVGGPTQDMLGTHMMLENSRVPFVTEIPGFNGYLTSRYSTAMEDWRDRIVFSIFPDEIRSIRLTYPSAPEKSFRIEKENERFLIKSGDGMKVIQKPDTIGLTNYLSFFSLLPFENWDKDLDQRQVDSLKASTPLAVISVTGITATTEVALYHKAINRQSLSQLDEIGNPLRFDMDRMYASIRQGKELVVIQYYSFGKVLRQFSDFDLNARKRK